MKKTNKFMGLSVLTIIMLVILDQLTKFQAVVKLRNGSPFVIIDGVFELRYLENQSAAFGFDIVSFFQKIFKIKYFTQNPEAFLTAKMVIFAIVTIAVVILLMIFYSRIPQTKRFLGINLILIFFLRLTCLIRQLNLDFYVLRVHAILYFFSIILDLFV